MVTDFYIDACILMFSCFLIIHFMIPRVNIGIFGRMNAGKSTFHNILTQNPSSIVDNTPGTTADAKVSFMEIHGIGACKIFDTAGLDEQGLLGEKKHLKTVNLLK